MTDTSQVVTLEGDPEHPGKLMMPFPPDLLAQMGWDYGDVLVWKDYNDSGFSLSKKE
jgi:hypothetical protein